MGKGRQLTQNGQWLCKSLALLDTPNSPIPTSTSGKCTSPVHYYFSSSPSLVLPRHSHHPLPDRLSYQLHSRCSSFLPSFYTRVTELSSSFFISFSPPTIPTFNLPMNSCVLSCIFPWFRTSFSTRKR